MAQHKNCIPWNKGLTKETDIRVKKNAQATSKALKGRKFTKEHKQKLKKIQKKIANDPRERKNRSLRAFKKGVGKWMKGRKNTPFLKAAKKNAQFRKGKTYKEIYGDKAEKESLKRKLSNRNRWKGKRKCDDRPYHNCSFEYIEWRIAVFKKDNYICQKCEQNNDILQAHHIKNWAQYPKLRYEISNGITLCIKCHKKFHTKYGIKNNTLEQLLKFLNK